MAQKAASMRRSGETCSLFLRRLIAIPKHLIERAISLNRHDDLEVHFNRWGLVPDGDLIVTRSSRLLPIRRNGKPAMLKIAIEPEEKHGAGLMVWWQGIGAARVLEHDDSAVMLEQAVGHRSLVDMASNGKDDDASRIICEVVPELHSPRHTAAPKLVPLTYWFGALDAIASQEGGIFMRSAATARALFFRSPRRCCASWRHSPRQRSRFRSARLARHRPEGAKGRTRLRLRKSIMQSKSFNRHRPQSTGATGQCGCGGCETGTQAPLTMDRCICGPFSRMARRGRRL